MKIYKHLIGALGLVVALASCDDTLSEINKNPNATEDPDPAYLLTSTEYQSAQTYWGSAASYNSTLLWAQHWAKIQYTEPDCYDVDNTDFTSTWNTFYATLISNLISIDEQPSSSDNLKAVAKIWRSWAYLQLTNFYGAIPYTEYGKSATPAYDSQEKVLRGLLQDLEDADASLGSNGGTIQGDLIYNNDISKWKKLAKSLRLRIALEIADRDEATAKSIIAQLYAERNNLISSNADNAKFAFAASPQWNPWASAFSSRDDQRVSKTLIDKLKELDDPRLAIYAQKPQDETVNTYEGAANGLSADLANNQGFYKVSRPGIAFLQDESPAVFFTYAEVLFTYAEAAARGWIDADASSLYEQAITASLQQQGITDNTVIAQYLARDGVKYDAAHWYESIGWQKWIAYYGQGPDAFTDWRRLGYPDLKPGPKSVLGNGEHPHRFFYPSTEQSLNGENYKAAVAEQGADEITTRLWFDVADKKR